ncbi:MAG TPA: glycosyltransferase, partial [Verrucomicrobia bacterium]|nr:glycosyltransferase [Verrucomicrobiota bacterium]
QVRYLMMVDGMHRFLPNLCVMQGAQVKQIPVNHRPRTLGVSKYTNFGR